MVSTSLSTMSIIIINVKLIQIYLWFIIIEMLNEVITNSRSKRAQVAMKHLDKNKIIDQVNCQFHSKLLICFISLKK